MGEDVGLRRAESACNKRESASHLPAFTCGLAEKVTTVDHCRRALADLSQRLCVERRIDAILKQASTGITASAAAPARWCADTR